MRDDPLMRVAALIEVRIVQEPLSPEAMGNRNETRNDSAAPGRHLTPLFMLHFMNHRETLPEQSS